jgi:hypothetical protein
LISQERPALNKLFVFKAMKAKGFQLEAELRSSPDASTEEVSALWIRIPGDPACIIDDQDVINSTDARPKPMKKFKANKITSMKDQLFKRYSQRFPGFQVHHVSLQKGLPLIILYKAMGFSNDEQIWKTFGFKDEHHPAFFDILQASFSCPEAKAIHSQDDAYIYIGKNNCFRSQLLKIAAGGDDVCMIFSPFIFRKASAYEDSRSFARQGNWETEVLD